MGKVLFERMRDVKNNHGDTYVSYFSNGVVEKNTFYTTKMEREANNLDAFMPIGESLYKATEICSHNYDFDTIDMDLIVGLVYKARDVDENNVPKKGATPLLNIVSCHTGDVVTYLDNEPTGVSVCDMEEPAFINYNHLVSKVKNNGLKFHGPKNYEEFVKAMFSGEPIDINLEANFKAVEQKKEKAKVLVRR